MRFLLPGGEGRILLHDQLTLQPRLQMLADMVPCGSIVADIGTDHGYLPVWLLQEGRIPRAIASDIHAKPLEHARETAAEFGVSDRIEFRLCAGLDGFVPIEVDTIVIAGMGGETIASILEGAPWTREDGVLLLLQPMTKTEYLRIWLADKGYHFTEERLVSDKSFLYPILCVKGGEARALTLEESYGGLLLDKDPLWEQYLSQQMKKIRIRMEGLTHSENCTAKDEIKTLCDLHDALASRKERLHDNGT